MHKLLKYFVLFVFLFHSAWVLPLVGELEGVAGSVRAQNDPTATIKALEPVIYKYHGQLRMDSIKLVQDIAKRYSKNPTVLLAIANMFYNAQDSAAAHRFEDKVLKYDPKYVTAYILRGNACMHIYQDTLAAKQWYQKAISVDPNDPAGYQAMFNYHVRQKNYSDSTYAFAYAKQLIENANTDKGKMAAVDIIGRMNGDKEQSTALLSSMQMDGMNEADLSRYAFQLSANRMYDRCQEAVNKGIAEYPDNYYFYRVGMYNYANQSNYEEAEKMGKKLFDMLPADSLSTEDYRIYSYCFTARGENDEAVDLLWKAIDTTNPSWDAAKQIKARLEDIYKDSAQEYINKGKYEQAGNLLTHAIDLFFDHKDEYRAVHCYTTLASMYAQTWAEELNGTEKLEPYNKAMAMYKDMFERCEDEDYKTSALYRQFVMSYLINQLDPSVSVENYVEALADRIFSHSTLGYYDANLTKALNVLSVKNPSRTLTLARQFRNKYPNLNDNELDALIDKLSTKK